MDRQTTDNKYNLVQKARPLVRSAKNSNNETVLVLKTPTKWAGETKSGKRHDWACAMPARTTNAPAQWACFVRSPTPSYPWCRAGTQRSSLEWPETASPDLWLSTKHHHPDTDKMH